MNELILPEACSLDELDLLLSDAMCAPTVAVDTETNGKDVRDGSGFAIGVSIAFRDLKRNLRGGYFPVAHTEGNISCELQKLLFQVLRSRTSLVYHNAKFDLDSLLTLGEDLSLVHYYCTMLMAHMCNENIKFKGGFGLDNLMKRELGIESGKLKDAEWEFYKAMYGWSPKFPAKVMARYAVGDAMGTLLLFERVYPFFQRQGFDGR